MSTPINCVGDHLTVGQITYPISDFTKLFPGDATINGHLICGANYGGPPTANAMFGPGFTGLPSLESIGLTNIYGKITTFAISDFIGITNRFGACFGFSLSSTAGVHLKNSLNLGNGPTVFNGPLTVNGLITVESILAGRIDVPFGTISAEVIISASVKNFNIKHPSKPGYRLVHSCLEGPEAGVYYRGHLKDNNKIILPDYWKNLIDIESITVHFTPHRFYQELYVKSIEWGKVINVVNNSGGSIDCDYIVYAERIDVEKIKVEYKEEENKK